MRAHPERLAEASRRRLPPETRTTRTPWTTVEGESSKRRPGGARWSARDAAGLRAKGEVEPRVTRWRQRLARLEQPRQALAEEAAVHGAWPRMIGRLADWATTRHDGLATADWTRTRDLIRAAGQAGGGGPR